MTGIAPISIPSATSAGNDPFPATGASKFLSLNPKVKMTNAQIDSVSQDFEAVFLTQMLKPMFEGDDTSSYFGTGTTGDVYKSYMLDAYGKAMSKAGGIGIADQVKKQLLMMQEVQP